MVSSGQAARLRPAGFGEASREGTTIKRLVRFGAFEVDFDAGEVRKHGRRLRVQEQPLHVLQVLLERAGEVVLREELRARLWPADTFVDFDNGLNNAVNKIRRALGDSAQAPAFVETVGRRGYRFIGAIDSDVRRAPIPAAGWAPPVVSSVAVLPLANLTGDSHEDYFADGMTDALISQIAGIRSLRVISRQSIVRYKGSRAPMPKIARELGVEGLIEGTVLRAGGMVRISVQLVHGPTDRHLWSGRWERQSGDVLVVQSEIAQAVAEAVRATVTSDEAARFARVRPINTGAYDAYLKGRMFWRHRTRDSLLRAVEYYRTAQEVEPGFALAYAAEAEACGPLGYLGFVPPHESTPAMRAAASKALELEPDLVEGLTALAACEAFHEWRWREGETSFRRAIAVNPNYPIAFSWYGLLLQIEGRHDESVAARRRGVDLDPMNLRARAAIGESLLTAGALVEAASEFRAVLELDPNHFFSRRGLGLIDLLEGRHGEAIEAFTAVGEHGSLAFALAAAGRIDDARAAVGALDAASRARYVSPVQHALASLGMDDIDQCIAALERGLAIHCIDLAEIRIDPRFSAIRGEPRFRNVIRAMHLPDPIQPGTSALELSTLGG